MNRDEEFEFKDFPHIPLVVKGSCNLFYENDSQFTPYYCYSSKELFVPTKKRWPEGASVSFEIRVLDEVRSFVGRGVVDSYTQCPSRALGEGMMIRLLDIRKRRMALGDRVNQLARINRIVGDISGDAVRYAVSEIKGNIVDPELGEPHAGFRDAVLLIQGWFGNRGVFSILEHRLKGDGFPVFSFELGRVNIQDIVKSAELTAKKLRQVCELQRLEKVSIVGHSMGGLIGLYALKFCGIAPLVRRMIAVGTPFHGTPFSYLGVATTGLVAKSVWQMVPNSPFIRNLLRAPMPEDVEIISIMSRHDLLAPEKSCVLLGAKNMLVAAGHTALIVNEDVYKFLSTLLKDQNPFEY